MTSVTQLLGPTLEPAQQPSKLYRVTVGLVVLLFGGLWLFEGHYLVTAWYPPLFDDLTPINGVAAGAFMTLMFACSILAWSRPRITLGPFRLLLVGSVLLAILLPMAFVLSAPIVSLGLYLVSVVLLGGMYLTHPGRDELIPSIEPNWPMLLGALLIAIPFAVISSEMMYNQIVLDDEIAQRWFYGGYALYLTAITTFAVVASLHRDTRLLFATAACFLALMLGMVSIVYPDELNSLGYFGGGLVTLWVIGFAMSTKWAGTDR